MEDWQLPLELQQLERDLRNRVVSESSPQLRHRVLDDAARRLRAERTRDRRQFVAGLAAAVLLWMNLSMSASQATDFGLHPSALDDFIEAGKSGQQEPSLRIDSTLSCLPDLSGHVDVIDNTNSRLIFRPGPNSQKERQ